MGWWVAFVASWVPTAGAQELAAQGLSLPPPPQTLAAPLLTEAPVVGPQGSFGYGVHLEHASRPAVGFRLDDAGDPVPSFLIDQLTGVGLGGRFSPAPRFGLAFSLPVWLRATGTAAEGGPAPGDAEVRVALQVLGQDRAGLTLVPLVSFPTGAGARLLGDAGPRVGTLLVAGVQGPLLASGEVGLVSGAAEQFGQQRLGGPQLRFGGALGGRFGPAWARVELRGLASSSQPQLDPTVDVVVPSAVSLPVEAALTLGVGGDRTAVSAGGSRPLTSGVGAAAWRGLVAVRQVGPLPAVEPEAEPDLGPITRFQVRDRRGRPVFAAVVMAGSEVMGTTDHDGVLEVPDLRWRRGVRVEHPSFYTERPSEVEPGVPVSVVLTAVPVPITWRVTDPEGRSLDATVRAQPMEGQADALTGPVSTLQLAPGTWRLRLEHEGLAAQERVVEVVPGVDLPEVVLLPPQGPRRLEVAVRADADRPVADARLEVLGLPVGAAGADGVFVVEGLPEGAVDLGLRAEGFTPRLWTTPEAVEVVRLVREPGAVRVRVRSASGQVVGDASVRAEGPTRLPPMDVGPTGERILQLSPGDWRVTVTSPCCGLQGRRVEVPDAVDRLTEVEVVLQPGELGTAELALTLLDPDGQPVEGAEVLLDGQPIGQTASGGEVLLAGLDTGDRQLSVTHPWLRPVEPWPVLLLDGPNERVLPVDWLPGVVRVGVDAGGLPPGDASLRWVGDASPPPPVVLPASGVAWAQLPPGAWSAVVASPTGGLAQGRVVIEPDARRLHRVNLRLAGASGEAALRLALEDPEREPVPEAEVRLDQQLVGSTDPEGEVYLPGLVPGPAELEVWAPLLAGRSGSIELKPDTTLRWRLDYLPGSLRIKAVQDGQPVDDALLRVMGPSRLPPTRVDAEGTRLLVLPPGRWQVLAASPTRGIGQATVEVGPNDALRILEIALASSPTGLVDALVRVEDDAGLAVPGAQVWVDGGLIGMAGEGGLLAWPAQPPGEVRLRVEAPGYEPSPEAPWSLVEDQPERLVRLVARPLPVVVQVVGPEGEPRAAQLRVLGPRDLQAPELSAEGRGQLALPPGRWEVIATAEGLGPARATVEVAPGQGAPAVRLVLGAPVARSTRAGIELDQQIRFDFGQAEVRPEAGPLLDAVAALLLSREGLIRLAVEGHADNVGDLAYNLDLSRRRAEAVRDQLVLRGVPRELLTAVGYGAQRPLASNDEEAGRSLNRRVAFQVLEERSSSPGSSAAPSP